MKKIMYIIIIISLLSYILLFPKDSVAAAAMGLNLWYEKMLPTLLPVSILSYILIHSGILDGFTRTLHRLIKHVFPISSSGLYPLVAGLLFGFPLGSKITAELVDSGKMSKEEGSRLYCICNNISPMFVSSFILNDCLQRPDLRTPTFLILYVPPLLLYMVQNRKKHFPEPSSQKQGRQTGEHIFSASVEAQAVEKASEKAGKKTASMNFQIIDAGIMNGFETLAKLGGYIMLFAILAQMTTLLPVSNPYLKCVLIGFTEITNGISHTAVHVADFKLAYPMMMAYTAFGGISGLAQTASMVKDTGFSLLPYIFTKIFGTGVTFCLSLLLIN